MVCIMSLDDIAPYLTIQLSAETPFISQRNSIIPQFSILRIIIVWIKPEPISGS